MRVGIGYDIHRLEAGRGLVIGGVQLLSERGALGHSDADVLLHALIDALLGAAALGDIGGHFPAGEPRWKDADSAELLRLVHAELDAAGWKIREYRRKRDRRAATAGRAPVADPRPDSRRAGPAGRLRER